MKKLLAFLKWTFIILLVLFVIAALALMMFIRSFDANKYKPQIISAAKQALSRDVGIENLSLKISLKSGIALQADGFTIKDDPSFSEGDFFKLNSLCVAVNIMDFIKARKLTIEDISVKEPTVALLRDRDGKINAATIGTKKEEAAKPQTDKPAEAKPLPQIFIRSFKMSKARVVFTDNMVSPAAVYTVDDINLGFKDFTVPVNGLQGLDLNLDFNVGAISVPQLISPVNAEGAVTVTDKDFTVKKLVLLLAKGVVEVKGKVSDYMVARNFDFDISVKELEVNDVLDQSKAQVKAAGVVALNMKTSGAASDLNSIKANGDIEVKPATLKGINILRMALDKIPVFDSATQQILASSDEQLAARLKSEDTTIDRISLKIVFADSVVNIDPVTVEAQDFTFSSKTTVDVAQNYALDGELKLSAQLSKTLGDAVDGFKYLYNDKKLIYIPVNVRGHGSDKPMIDVTKIVETMAQNALNNKGAQEIDKALEKYVGKDSGVGEAVTGLFNKFLKPAEGGK